jgi:hypothetical protein
MELMVHIINRTQISFDSLLDRLIALIVGVSNSNPMPRQGFQPITSWRLVPPKNWNDIFLITFFSLSSCFF